MKLRSPKPNRPLSKNKGKDSNAFSRQASIAAAEHSPRGFRIEGWALFPKKRLRTCKRFAEKGTFDKRPFPPKERKFFPNIIREDKEKQAMLEKKHNKPTAIVVMKIQQEEYLNSLKTAERNGWAKEIKGRFQRDLKSMERIARRHKVLEMAEDVKRRAEQAMIQLNIVADQFRVLVVEETS